MGFPSQNYWLNQAIVEIQAAQATQGAQLAQLVTAVQEQTATVADMATALAQVDAVTAQQSELLSKINLMLVEILAPPLPTGFAITMQAFNNKGEMLMAITKPHKLGAVDLQIEDDGSVTYTLTPTDAANNPTTLPVGTPPLTATSSNPDLTLAISTADTSGFGLIWTGTPTPGGGLATGIIATFTTTLPGATAPITASAAPVDIVADAVSGFAVAETAVP